MKLYFVRHGQSVANLLHEFSNSGLKHPLTETGQEQARQLALSFSGLPIERIYSSPVLRAMQTAQVLSAALQAPLEITEALREWSVGSYEGTTDPVGWEMHRQVQRDWFFAQKYESKMPGGENFYEIQARFGKWIEQLMEDGKDTDRQIICVAHGGLYVAMLPHFIKNIDYDFAIQQGFPYTGRVETELRPEGLVCLSWCGIKRSD